MKMFEIDESTLEMSVGKGIWKKAYNKEEEEIFKNMNGEYEMGTKFLDKVEEKVRDYYLEHGENKELEKLEQWFYIEFNGTRHSKQITITNEVECMASDANVNKTYMDSNWNGVFKKVFDVFDKDREREPSTFIG